MLANVSTFANMQLCTANRRNKKKKKKGGGERFMQTSRPIGFELLRVDLKVFAFAFLCRHPPRLSNFHKEWALRMNPASIPCMQRRGYNMPGLPLVMTHGRVPPSSLTLKQDVSLVSEWGGGGVDCIGGKKNEEMHGGGGSRAKNCCKNRKLLTLTSTHTPFQ